MTHTKYTPTQMYDHIVLQVLKSRCVLPGDTGGDPLAFSISQRPLHSSPRGLSSVFSSLLPLSPFLRVCEYIGPTCIVQGNVLISRFLISATSAKCLLPHKIAHSQVAGIRMRTSLGAVIQPTISLCWRLKGLPGSGAFSATTTTKVLGQPGPSAALSKGALVPGRYSTDS